MSLAKERQMSSQPNTRSIGIPPSSRSTIQAIATWPDETFEPLRAALAGSQGGSLLDMLRAVRAALPEQPITPQMILGSLGGIDSIRAARSWSSEQAGAAVALAKDVELDDAARERLQLRISALLEGSNIAARAQEANALVRTSNLFIDADLFTDLRAIFDADNRPTGGVILHHLRVTVSKGEDDQGELSIVLEEDDVRTLRLLLDNAESRAAQLREAAHSANIHTAGNLVFTDE